MKTRIYAAPAVKGLEAVKVRNGLKGNFKGM